MNNNSLKLLLGLCLVMFVILLMEWSVIAFSENSVPAPTSKNDQQTLAKNDYPKLKMAKQSLDDFSDMLERPLFIEGRKIILDAEKASSSLSDGSIDDFLLTGIYSIEGQLFALFSQQGAEKNFVKRKQKEDISGWLLKEIKMDRVVLEKNQQEKTVLLRKPKPKLKAKQKKATQKKSIRRKPVVRKKTNLKP